MTESMHHLLESFNLLSTAEKHQFTLEILRRSTLDSPPLTDDEVDALADELFQQYDREESEDAET